VPASPAPPTIAAALKARAVLARLLSLLPPAILCGAGGVLLFGDVSPAVRDGAGPIVILAGASAWFLAVGAIDLWRLLKLGSPVLVVDENGILDRRLQSRPVPWTAIRRAEFIAKGGSTLLLGIWGDGVEETLAAGRRRSLLGANLLARRLARRFGLAPLTIDVASLNVSAEALRATIRAHWGEPDARPLPTDLPRRRPRWRLWGGG